MKGVDRNRRFRSQKRLMQHARARQRRTRFRSTHAALAQESAGIVSAGQRQMRQPGIQARAHFLGGFAREG